MARKWRLLGAAAALWAVSGAAWACADVSCGAHWKLSFLGRDCANRAIIAPSNDTQVNLLFLLRDKAGLGSAGLSYPKQSWDADGFGHTYFSWEMLTQAFYPSPADAAEASSQSFQGTRCASVEGGARAFGAALAASPGIPATERGKLAAARERLAKTCEVGAEALRAGTQSVPDWPAAIDSSSGKAFLTYLLGADAFYGERWGEARFELGKLSRAADPWVAEAASYMLARVELNAAMAKSIDEYGYFAGPQAVDQALLGRASAALAAYLKAYPGGTYAQSAKGLQRRVLWLGGDTAALSQEYERLLAELGGRDGRSVDLIEEIDNKLLFPRGEASAETVTGPMLLATQFLARMRYVNGDESKEDVSAQPKLTLAEMEGQRGVFGGHPDLWTFLQASHAFSIGKDPKRVLALIPDDAKRKDYTPLAFSRQMLRGMALARLGDRNEAGFWLDLLGGSTGLWQRPTVELALALNYERHDRLAAVFAKDSPIRDSDIRMILLSNSASPDILRAQVQDRSRPASERNVAQFALLDKALSRGNYGLFLANQSVAVPAVAEDAPERSAEAARLLPSFTRGQWAEDYACPTLAETARKLAANGQDASARLCLGEFWRLNGFDRDRWADGKPKRDELGGAADLFPGKPTTRGPIYAAIIADPRAAAADKAYALYRAIHCYGPGGYNACGGPDVDKAQRRAWFQRLKRDYAGSEWARRQRIYW